MTNSTSICTSRDILGLKPGETAMMTVRLNAVLRDGSLSLGFVDVERIVVEIPDGPLREIALDHLRGLTGEGLVRIVATRTTESFEIDGMAALATETARS